MSLGRGLQLQELRYYPSSLRFTITPIPGQFMPKMKSHKASKRRLRITPSGKIQRTQCGVRHLLTHRSPKRLRKLHKKTTTTTAGYVRRVRFALLKGQP
jgi:large subunit ribosomal protein L35